MTYALQAKMNYLNQIFTQAQNFMAMEGNQDKRLEEFLPKEQWPQVAQIFSQLAEETCDGNPFFARVQTIMGLWDQKKQEMPNISYNRVYEDRSFYDFCETITILTQDVNAYIADLESSKKVLDEDNLGSFCSLAVMIAAGIGVALVAQWSSLSS
jgi:hypothetical protein